MDTHSTRIEVLDEACTYAIVQVNVKRGAFWTYMKRFLTCTRKNEDVETRHVGGLMF